MSVAARARARHSRRRSGEAAPDSHINLPNKVHVEELMRSGIEAVEIAASLNSAKLRTFAVPTSALADWTDLGKVLAKTSPTPTVCIHAFSEAGGSLAMPAAS
jgi:hypothetical protein